MSCEWSAIMIHSFFSCVRAQRMTASAVAGLLLLCSEGSAKTAITRLPTITGDKVVNDYLEAVRHQLRLVLKEQEDAARELLALAKTDSGPARLPPLFQVLRGGREG